MFEECFHHSIYQRSRGGTYNNSFWTRIGKRTEMGKTTKIKLKISVPDELVNHRSKTLHLMLIFLILGRRRSWIFTDSFVCELLKLLKKII